MEPPGPYRPQVAPCWPHEPYYQGCINREYENYIIILFEIIKPQQSKSYQNAVHIPWQDNVIKRKHFARYWAFVWGVHRSPVNSHHKGQWRGALMFSLICAWTNGWVNIRDAGDLRCHRAHYDDTVMEYTIYDLTLLDTIAPHTATLILHLQCIT